MVFISVKPDHGFDLTTWPQDQMALALLHSLSKEQQTAMLVLFAQATAAPQ